MKNTFGENLRRIREERGLSQEQFALIFNTSKQVISRYETGQRSPKINTVSEYAQKLNVDISALTGYSDGSVADDGSSIFSIPGILPIRTKKIPLLGEIACGVPIYADEHFEGYVECGADIHADFALKAKGDSMINARILDGDIVFVRKQSSVNPGEIAVVVIDEEATLKRFRQQGNLAILSPENPEYDPIVVDLENNESVHILGKAIAFQSDVR